MDNKDSARSGSWVVAFTGASGMRYGLRLLEIAAEVMQEVHVVFSEAAIRVLREEEGLAVSASTLSMQKLCGSDASNVRFYNPRDIGAKIASGSALFDGMVIVPCTMGTLAAVAHGICENLIHRAADVTLKEGRRLVVVPRETPLSAIHLENMLTLTRAGARMVPAMPGFYHQPKSIDDVVDMMVMKILDQMGIHRDLVPRWKQEPERSDGRLTVIGVPKFNMGVA
jgi:4-hydroxy-3-polyprenylbenzoate decarboxylase